MTASRSWRCASILGVLLLSIPLAFGGGPFWTPAGRAHAQQPAQVPDPSCAPGELCVPDQNPDPGEAEERPQAPVNDPPGRYLRSLSTMALIAVIVGAYLFLAFSGKSLRRVGRQQR